MNKEQIEDFLKNENIAFGRHASVSKAVADRNGTEYYLTDLLEKFQDAIVNETIDLTSVKSDVVLPNISDPVCEHNWKFSEHNNFKWCTKCQVQEHF